MAGISLNGPSGGRRALDSELNMVPMIDLLMVTISFLLITAVWSHNARLDASAKVPGPASPCAGGCTKDTALSLHVRTDKSGAFMLEWHEANQIVSSVAVDRKESVAMVGTQRIVRFPELERAIAQEWQTKGQHRDPADPLKDRAVLHANDDAPYASMVAMLDAMRATDRELIGGQRVAAFQTTLATDP